MKLTKTILLLLVSLNGYSQFSFERFDLNEILDGIESIHSVDFDNDGDMDIFTSSRNDNKVMLFEQFPGGIFVSQILSSEVSGANVVKSYDLDLDGDLDIIASGSLPGNHSLSWWENVNNQFSTRKLIVNINNQAFQDFQISDIDEDGDLDIITVEFATASGPGSLSMWVNNNLNFELLEISDNCIDGRQIELFDWDNDNDLDLLISEGIGDKMTFWENKGSLEFEKNTFFNYDICNSFGIADLDNDGDNDIVALSFTGDEVSYWLNDGENNFSKTVIEDQYDGPDKLLVKDIDQDDDLDIIVAYYLEDFLVIYENIGNLEFTKSIIDSDFDGGRDLCIVDINNDKSLDILGAALGDKKAIVWSNNQVVSSTKELDIRISSIFPNPTSGILNIKHKSREPISIAILNCLGQPLIKLPYSDRLDLSSIIDGVYFIQVNYPNAFETHKLIIQK